VRKLIPIVLLILLSIPAGAADITAASCSRTDVQAAIDSAVAGDRILVPAGSCTWTSSVVIPDGRNLTVEGAGKTSTIITCNTGGDCFSMRETSTRLTAFQFVVSSGNNTVNAKGQNWRVDNNKFVNTQGTFKKCVYANGQNATNFPKGLVDNNEFINCAVLVFGGPTNPTGLAAKRWAEPLGLGTDDAVYIEDNTFLNTIFGNVVDSNLAGKYVFRHNTVDGAYCEAHSSWGDSRAVRKWEIYNNTFSADSRDPGFIAFIRGGTGVVFGNTLIGTGWSNPRLVMDNRRSFEGSGGSLSGKCDGTSIWDGNDLANGHPCRDQIGRSTDDFEWVDNDTPPDQASDPAYFWDNTIGGNPLSIQIANSSSIHIQVGRDFFKDSGAKPGYTPFIYPHPLASGAVPPAPPTNLGVVVR